MDSELGLWAYVPGLLAVILAAIHHVWFTRRLKQILAKMDGIIEVLEQGMRRTSMRQDP